MPTRPPQHKPAVARTSTQHDARPGYVRLYDRHWRRARLAWLGQHPLCVLCMRHGNTVEATVVDHITPHKGDRERFWDADGNWMSLCKRCHDRKSVGERDSKRCAGGGQNVANVAHV